MKNLTFKGKTNIINGPTKLFIYKSLLELTLNQESPTLNTEEGFLVDIQDVIARLEKEIENLEGNALKEKKPAKTSLENLEKNKELGKIVVTLLTNEFQNGTQLSNLETNELNGLSSQKMTSIFKTIDKDCFEFKKIKGVNHYRKPQNN